MNRFTKISVLFIVIAMFASVLVPFTSNAQANEPEWEVGDEWSMGYEKELDNLFTPAFDMIDNQTQNSEEISDISYNLDGKIGFYQIYKIKDEGNDHYTMRIKAGGGLKVSGDFSMTGELPKEGTHTADEYDKLPTEGKTVSGEGDMQFSIDISGTANFTKEDKSVKDLHLTVTIKASGDYKINNWPDEETNWDWENGTVTQTAEYKDYDGGFDGKVESTIDVTFEPALDLFDYPIQTGEEWGINSTMTVSGTYSGEIDAHGLPEEIKKSLEDEDIELPLTLEDMDTGESEIHDGIIEETTTPINFKMACTGTEEIVLEDGSTTETYLLKGGQLPVSPSTEGMMMHYSPEEGFIVSEEFSSTSNEMERFIGTDEITMQPKSEKDAEENIESLQNMDESEEGLFSKLFEPPYLYILIAGIAAVVIIGVLMKRRGGKKDYYGEYQYQQQSSNQEQRPTYQEPQQGQTEQNNPYQENNENGPYQ